MLYWLTSLAALIGIWLNIRGHVACFWIWAVTNLIWAIADLQHGLPQQAVLQGIYFGMSIYGIWCWSSRSRAGNRIPSRSAGGSTS